MPILLGAFWRWPGSGQEIEVLAGLGPAAGRFTSDSPGSQTALETFGVGGEFSVGYLRSLTDRLALQIGMSARGAALKTRAVRHPNPAARGHHGELPFLAGLRFRL